MMLLHISFYTGVLQFNFDALLLRPFFVLLMHCRNGPLFISVYPINLDLLFAEFTETQILTEQSIFSSLSGYT